MASLSARDLARLLDLVRDLHDAEPSALPAHCVAALRSLIGVEVATCSDFDLRTSVAIETVDPSERLSAAAQEVFEHYLHEHPLITHYARTGDGRAFKSSDFISQSQLRRLGLYNEYIKPFFGTHYQMAFAVAARRSRVIGMSLARVRRDFSERERLMLNVLRPHIAHAMRQADMAATGRGIHGTVVADDDRRRWVTTDMRGRVGAITPMADVWLRRFFGPARSPHQLPPPLWRWVTAQVGGRDRLDLSGARDTLVVQDATARLILRCLVRGNAISVMLELVDLLDVEPTLRRLGLTPREAEVLMWVTEGKDTRSISTIIGSSMRTVEKHLERVFRKLGVENRTAAAAAVHALRR